MPDINPFQQKILILGDGTMYDECVTRLLLDRTDWAVSHEVYRSDCDISEVIDTVTPDVILVNLDGNSEMTSILKTVMTHPKGNDMRILQNRFREDISIIDIYILLALSNGEKYFRPQHCVIRTADQIVNVIRSKENG
jgi:hypothetical protein